MAGIVDWAGQHAWRLLNLGHFGFEMPPGVRPDGMLLHLGPEQHALARRLAKRCKTVVQVDRFFVEIDAPRVVSDLRMIGQLAVEHFLQRGFRTFVCLKYAESGKVWAYESFAEYLAELDLPCHVVVLRSIEGWGAASFRRAAVQFGKQTADLSPPLALFAANDLTAVRATHVCRALGLSIPEQVAVLGVHNDALRCQCATVGLSSIDTNRYRLGHEAAALLGRLMDGQAPPEEPVLVPPSGVVGRLSTDILAVGDTHVARALRFMWENLHRRLSVGEIAAAAAVSRRKLERRFRKHLGRGINEELIRKRLERCRELLKTTDQPIARIAGQIGFRSGEYLHTVFARAYGMTPRQYRLRE